MRRRRVAWGRVTEGWDQFSEDFTFPPEGMPGTSGWKMPKCEHFWTWHLIYGLSAGFPLCCVLNWTKNAAGFETIFGRSPADRRRKRDIGLRHREGHNELGQHFVVCPREVHDESYLAFHVHNSDEDHRGCPYCPLNWIYEKCVPLEHPCSQCCPDRADEADGAPAVSNGEPESGGSRVREERPPGDADDCESQLRDLWKRDNLREDKS